MKHFFKLTCAAAILTAGIITLSCLRKERKVITEDRGHEIDVANKTSDGTRMVAYKP